MTKGERNKDKGERQTKIRGKDKRARNKHKDILIYDIGGEMKKERDQLKF